MFKRFKTKLFGRSYYDLEAELEDAVDTVLDLEDRIEALTHSLVLVDKELNTYINATNNMFCGLIVQNNGEPLRVSAELLSTVDGMVSAISTDKDGAVLISLPKEGGEAHE